MNWTASEIRQLRYRMGWSQAEMARFMNLDHGKVSSWEEGSASPEQSDQSSLFMILQTANACAQSTVRRPIAEVVMRDRGLSQIHKDDIEN